MAVSLVDNKPLGVGPRWVYADRTPTTVFSHTTVARSVPPAPVVNGQPFGSDSGQQVVSILFG